MPKLLAIKLLHRCEDDCLGRHVQSDREGLGSEEDLDETLLEQDLDNLFEQGQKTSVMDTDTSSQEGKNVTDLRQLLVLVVQSTERIVEDVFYRQRFFLLVHVNLGHLHRQGFALSLGKGKDNDRVEVFQHDHLDQLVDIGSLACNGRVRSV